MTHAERILQALRRLERRRRRLSILRRAADSLTLVGLWLGGVAATDAYAALGSRTRLALGVLLCGGFAFLLFRMARTWLGRADPLADLARHAEALDPALDERLITVVTQVTLPEDRRASATLNEALLERVASEVAARPPARQLSWRTIRRPLLRAACVGLIWLIVSWVPGVPLAALVGRQVLPLAAIPPVAGIRIELSATPPAIAQGDTITIEATLVGGNAPAVLEVGPIDGELRPIAMEHTFGQTYTTKLLSPQHDLIYRVRAGAARTPPVVVRVQRRPGMTAMTADIRLPDGRVTPWSPEAGRELVLPVGASLEVRFRSTEPLRAAVLRSASNIVAASAGGDKQAWRAVLPVTADADWNVELSSEVGLTANVPLLKVRAEP